MRHFTQKELEELSESGGIRQRISDFLMTDGSEFFEEVQAALSPRELEEYLEENPDERRYLNKKERPVK